MKIPQEALREQAKEYGIVLTAAHLAQLELYATTLVEWNEMCNLTAITAPDEIAAKHFLDSLLLLTALELPQNAAVIDVGTGAGFPAVPCKLVRADMRLTLLDSLNKRITFLNALCEALAIQVTTIHARAEERARRPGLRECFDVATARAVASLQALAEYCLPYVKVGGTFAALKGYEIEEELALAKPAIKLLGGQVERVEKYLLPDGSRRSIVLIKKISQTPPKYPRQSGKIVKTPL